MSEIKKQWYVIRAVGGKEAKVKEYIEAEVRHNHLEDYISQVLIPTEKVYTIRNGKKISKEKVSYPGYVLVEAAFVGQIPIMLRNTPNVLGFLGDTKEESRKMIATPLRPQEVARILGRVDEMSVMEEENEIPFFVGETVKVTDGPFSSFQGTIEAVDNERKKLTVSVKIFGRKTPWCRQSFAPGWSRVGFQGSQYHGLLQAIQRPYAGQGGKGSSGHHYCLQR